MIPLYNHAAFVREAIESAVSQTHPPHEIIVVDDGSTDGSDDVVRRVCDERPGIIYWRQPNRGAHYALNAGIHRATGDVVAILNSDDTYPPRRLEECALILRHNPRVSLVATTLTCIDAHGSPVPNEWYDQSVASFHDVGDLALALANANFVMTTSNFVIRRSVFDDVGYFAPMRFTHDLEFLLRLNLLHKTIYFHERPLLNYRIHGTNTIKEDHRRVRAEWAMCIASYLLNYTYTHPYNPSHAGRLSAIVQTHSLERLVVVCTSYLLTNRPLLEPLSNASILEDIVREAGE